MEALQKWARIDVSNLLVVGVVLPLSGSQRVIHDKIGNFAAQALAGSQVEVEMLPAEDTAQRRFLGGGRDACEGTFDSRENLRRNVEIGMVPLEKGNQHLCCGSAYHPMSARIGWVGSSFADFREPIRISHGFRIDSGIGRSNGGYLPLANIGGYGSRKR